MKYYMDEEFENQLIDRLVAEGYDEDRIIDAILDVEEAEGITDDLSFEGTYYASGKKAERQAKKEAKKAAKAEKKAAKKVMTNFTPSVLMAALRIHFDFSPSKRY